jgi:DNA-binding MarR family transcriptional regulator
MQNNSLLALSGVYHIKERLFSRLLRRHGMDHLSPAQGRILMALWEQDDIPVRQLAALTSLDKSTLSLSLSRMEQYGVVQRLGDTADRRVVRVKLTDRGRELRHSGVNAMQELEEILFEDIPNEEKAAFLRVLEQVYVNAIEQEQLREI